MKLLKREYLLVLYEYIDLFVLFEVFVVEYVMMCVCFRGRDVTE